MPARRSQSRSHFQRRSNASEFQRLSNISRSNVQHTSRSRRGRVRNTIRRFVPNLQTEINRENAILAAAASHIVANNSNQLPVIRRYEAPPYFLPQVRAMRVDVRQLIDRINYDIDASITQQSSSIVQKIIGVTDRSDIESQGATSQMKHIRDRLMTFGGRRNPPWVYNSNGAEDHNKSIRTIDNILNNRTINSKCYGTSKKIHFTPYIDLQLKNEWEHLVPNLYQLLINGLAYTGDKSMAGLLKLALGNIFGQNSDNIYKEFENICYLAQNRCLLLSAKAFNQAKCSYMLFKVDYVDYYGNGNYIIELSVDNDIVDIVYERMRDGRRSHYKACYSNDPEVPPPLMRKSQFIRNLKKVANEYNSVMRENNGYFGKIIFACGCISAAMLAYNCPNGRQIYNTAVGTGQNLPLVYYMAKKQIDILRSLVPVIGGNPAILTGGALSTADGLNDFYRYPNYNKMDMPSYDLTPIQEHLSPVSNVPTISPISPNSPIFSKSLIRRYKNPRTRIRSKTRSKFPKTLSKRMTFSNSPLNVNKESVEVNENDISESHEFLKGSIDILNRLFTDKRIIWDNDLYSYRFKKSQSAGRRKTTRRTKRRTKRR